MNFLLRKMVSKSRPTITVTKETKENEYKISTKVSIKTVDIVFILGEVTELNDERDGTKKKVSIYLNLFDDYILDSNY